MAYLLVSLAFFFPGLVIGRWFVLFAPVGVWTLWAIGLDARWWGDKPGEFLVLGTVILVAIGVASAAAGVLVYRSTRGRQRRA